MFCVFTGVYTAGLEEGHSCEEVSVQGNFRLCGVKQYLRHSKNGLYSSLLHPLYPLNVSLEFFINIYTWLFPFSALSRPCILVMDSLKLSYHENVCKLLRE